MSSSFDGGYPNNLSQPLWPFWLPILPIRYQVGPVFTLPVRALQKIFLYACDTYTLEDQMPDLWIGRARDVMLAPVTLSHVCRRWRNIANTTPRLWRNVVVRFTPWTSTSATEMLEEFIIKSDPYTINVCFLATPEFPPPANYSAREIGTHIIEYPPHLFEGNGGCPPMEQRSLDWPVVCSGRPMEIINTVIQSSRRWKRVFFSGSMSAYEELFCRRRPALYLPELTSLEVPKGGVSGAEKNLIFEHAYALRCLRVTGTTFAHYVLPWNGLRVLHTAITRDIEILEMLAHCPHLEELVIQDPWTGRKRPTTRRVLLPKLQLLSFTTYTRGIDDAPLHLMDSLITPSILEIRLSDISSKTPFTRALRNLAQLLRRSCACHTLQRIYLMSVLLVEEDLIGLLDLTQSLVSLHVDLGPTAICIPSTENLLARLSNTGDLPPFLPRLRALTCFGIQFVVKDLITALHARSKSIPELGGITVIQHLRDVHIHLPHSTPLSSAVQVMADSLRECGVNLEMNSPGIGNCECLGS